MLAPSGYAEPEPTISEVQDRVDSLYHRAEQATERYHAATEELQEVQRRIERARTAVSRQQAAVEDVQAQMAGFAAASYRAGGFDPTLRTFLAESPAEFLAQASVVDAYATQQTEQLAEAAEVRRGLEQARMVADEELARQRAIEAELETEKQAAERLLGEAEDLLSELEAEERRRLEEQREREREEEAEQPSRDDDGEDDEETLPDVPSSEKGQIVVDFAMSQLGDAYCWGGNGPDCWDCSGLTSAAWAEAGVSLPRSSGSQINSGSRVSKSQLEPGDLVFFYSPISHVGIYLGDGQMVHATHPGDVVSVDPIDTMPFAGATRPG
ncbi:cell wall-associated NlpC family hydrolase [Haloactinopolyspora alba]|uniref:Cell wall-associated NlpC family hydrolase n=1 Tax=Haloactinopolyspora alba TaxID=648780 RepID=A0A2P8DR69_9ACTN|nr:NlpC/P60 family protein [Haloactinopolyspora alba]PSK99705.1 cell wall-associated NlpC family hydrolase [Haloactinopolyspora alba]